MTSLELVSSGVIDLYEDIPISLNFSIADIENPDTRTATYSKTITLPGTKNNNDLFKHIYQIDSYSNFNPNNKAKINLYQDDILILNGYLKLTNIITQEEKIEYEVTIYSNVGNIFLDIGENLLSDIDLSAYNHTYNGTNIQNSWTATLGQGYVYPCIDYGNAEKAAWATKDFKPAIYAKQYIDKIFSNAGYTYSSPFFNSEYFKRFIIPYTGGNLKYTDDQLTPYYFQTKNNGFSLSNWSTWYTIPLDSTISDASSQVDLTNDLVRCALTCNYTISITISGGFQLPYGTTQPAYFFFTVDLYNSTGTRKQNIIGIDFVKSYSRFVSGTTYSIDTQTITSSPVTINQGDYLVMKTEMVSQISSAYFDFVYLQNQPLSSEVQAGGTIFINNTIPKNVKQKDFLTSIFKMFNLYVDKDKSNDRNYIIEPRNDFYSSGVITDWSSKVDYSNPVLIKPTTDIMMQKYIYRYKQDKDFVNTVYQNKYSESFGTKNYFLNYDLIKGEKVTEVIFSNTPLINKRGRYFPVIESTNTTSTITVFNEYNIRILYYGGLLSTSGFKFGTQTLTSYPYCGYLDNPTQPYRDISFGVPIEVYHNPRNYTNNNLFNVFHKSQLQELTNQNARIVTCSVLLKPTDIASLDFRNIIYFDNHYLRLLSIEDYNPNKTMVCKCTFLKIKNKDIAPTSVFTITQPTIYGGVKSTI